MSSNSPTRLPAPWGSQLDRSRPVSFTFEGREYSGYAGDTLGSALAANDQWLLSRSFKYHRPRAAFSWCGMDANSYVQLPNEPNVMADTLPISDGLIATGQNYVGSLNNDRASLTGLLSRFLPVGFYYRTFFKPRGAWPWWERLFRRAAGLGRIDTLLRGDYSDKKYLFPDVAVIGAGPAGLSAALAAAREGAEVLLVEESAEPGGSLNYARFQRDREEIDALRDRLLAEVSANGSISLMTGACCTGWFADNWLAVQVSGRLCKVRAREVVLCTGSVEQPLVFRNNDLPGVLPASGVQRLMRQYGVKPGTRAVVATANVEGYDAAIDLLDAGVTVLAIADLNADTPDSEAVAKLRAPNDDIRAQAVFVEAVAGKGNRSIKGVVVKRLDGDGAQTGDGERIDCDLVVTSIGYAPLGQLACHSGASLGYDESVHTFALQGLPAASGIAGSLNHRYTLENVLADGEAAGRDAARRLAESSAAIEDRPADASAGKMNHPWPVFPHRLGKEFVDFDEDQTIGDLQNAVTDGFDHVELAKRYSTVAMGPSQGRLSSLNALRIVNRFSGTPLDNTCITTQRPPFRPISFATLAGRPMEPVRLTPMHDWHIEQGASMMPAGSWQRPASYGPAGQRSDAIAAEVAAVRNSVGIIDVSTLGGIEIRGLQADEFLNRLYTFAYSKLPVGRTRYLLRTDDAGAIVDDGVACRLGDQHFYVTTTTTGSDSAYRDMLHRNAEWGLEVEVTNVTSTNAGISIAGPHSRTILQKLDSDIDFGREQFTYLDVRQGLLCGVSATVMRVGFVGELGFEIHVPWAEALAVWEHIVSAGSACGIRPVGVEAQRVLRLEKGHIIVGQDTDGLTTPGEAALGWAIAGRKPYFVGRAPLKFMEQKPPARKLVGFALREDAHDVPEECHLVIREGVIVGRVTSVARSVAVGKTIGLAYVAADQAEAGGEFQIKVADGGMVTATVENLPFYDPGNARQEM